MVDLKINFHVQFFRCCDGTEFGSGFGSIVCPDCKAEVSPTSVEEDVDWLCEGCKKKKPAKDCIEVLEKLNMELEEAPKKGETNHPKCYERVSEKMHKNKSKVQCCRCCWARETGRKFLPAPSCSWTFDIA